MVTACWRQVEVHSTGKLLSRQLRIEWLIWIAVTYQRALNRDYMRGCGQYVTEGDIRRAHAFFAPAFDQACSLSMHRVRAAGTTKEALESAATTRTGIGLNGLAQLLTDGLRRLAEGEGLDGVFVQEESDVDQCQDGVQLFLAVDALRTGTALEGQVE